jgi:hypothetical protein
LIGRGIETRGVPMFRISKGGKDPVVDVTTFQQLVVALRAGKRGRFHIHEITPDPLPKGRTSRRWGVGIKWADGTVVIERDPADA